MPSWFLQNLADVLFWVSETPRFGKQAVFLDQSAPTPENTSLAYMESLKADIIAGKIKVADFMADNACKY